MADIQTIGERIGLPNHLQIMGLQKGQDFIQPEDRDGTNTFTVLVNPASYSTGHQILYSEDQAIQTSVSDRHINKVTADDFSVELLFDSTGSLGKIPFVKSPDVLEQISRFLDIVYPDTETPQTAEQPGGKEDTEECKTNAEEKKLLIIWGKFTFSGSVTSVNIKYTHFDHTGSPIRATASCSFKGRKGFKYTRKKPKKNPLNPDAKLRDINKQKHAINAVRKYGSYIALLSTQPRSGLPKTLRKIEEIIKLFI